MVVFCSISSFAALLILEINLRLLQRQCKSRRYLCRHHQSPLLLRELVTPSSRKMVNVAPSNWDGLPPPRGSEVFVGKIPRDCELLPVFEQIGSIYEIRLMMDHLIELNWGYAFIYFSTPTEAKECVQKLNHYDIRPGRTLGVCMSLDNCRLFIGGIPKKVRN